MSDEPVDIKPEIEDKCKPSCAKTWTEYEGCVERVKSDTTGEAHCVGQYVDFLHCIDTCATPKFWPTLK